MLLCYRHLKEVPETHTAFSSTDRPVPVEPTGDDMAAKRAWAAAKAVALVATCLVATGCTGAAGPPETNLQSAATQLKSTLDNSTKDITHLRREQVAYSWVIKGSLTAEDFYVFACSGVGAFTEQQAAVGTIQQLATTVSTLTAPPSTDLSTVLGSISKYSDKVEPFKEGVGGQAPTEAAARAACEAQTKADVATFRGATGGKFFLAAAPLVFTAVQGLVGAVQKLVLLGAQQVDSAQRTAQFQAFMDSHDTSQALQPVLGPCAVHKPDTVDNPTLAAGLDKYKDIRTYPIDGFDQTVKDCMTALGPAARIYGLSNEKMQGVIDERRRLALLVPYNQFMAISVTRDATGSYSKYLANIDKVDSALATFDSLRTQKVAKDQHLNIVLAVDNLWRTSQGRLTAKESAQALWGAAQNLSALLSALSSDIGGVQDQYKALTDALQKL